MNKTYIKSIFKDMEKTKGKIISIMVMVALATMVVVGLFLSGVTMRKSLTNSLKSYKHPDIIVRSSYGLDYEDNTLLENEKDIEKIKLIRAVDLQDGQKIIRLKEYDKEMPKAVLTEGDFPKKSNEIILDENLKDAYKIGDKITFSYINEDQKKDKQMKNLNYEVKGFYKSSDHFMEDMKEISPIGKSELSGYALTLADNFKLDKYHEANIFYTSLKDLDPSLKTYKEKVLKKGDKLEERLKNRPGQVLEKIRTDANKEIKDAESDLSKASKELTDNEKKLLDGQKKLDEGFIKYQENKEKYQSEIKNAQNDLDQAREDLDKGWAKLKDGQASYEKNKKEFDEKISQAEYQIADKESDLNLAYAKIDQPKKELMAGYDDLNQTYEYSLAKLNEGKASLLADEESLRDKKAELESLRQMDQTEEIENQIYELENDISRLEEVIESTRNEFLSKEDELNNKYNEEKYKLDQALGELRNKEDELDRARNLLERSKEDLSMERTTGEEKLNKAKEELAANEKKLLAGEDDYKKGLEELEKNKNVGISELDKAYKNLLAKEEELNANKNKFENEKSKANKDIKKAKEDIKESKDSLLSLIDPEYQVETIFDNQGINTYYQNSLNMDKLSKVFPAFFYLVAMLVTLTTMKRYIDEERTINGTLKSLGYSNQDIAKRFYIYGLVPTLIGAILGAIIGRFIILKVIFTAYSTGFKVLAMDVSRSLPVIFLSILVSTLLIALTVRVSSKETVREVPANLLRRKAPVSGTSIFLEKIRFIWKKLSFMQKITARNIFRYKSRMFMTIFGVGGCTALLFFGFAMIDAIKDTSTIQQEEILHYQAVSIVNTLSKKEDLDKYNREISSYENIPVYNKRAKLKNDGKSQELSLLIPENDKTLKDFVSLRDLKRKEIDLNKSKVVLTENIAKKLNLGPDDKIRVEIDGEYIDLKIGDISENYVGDYLYISRDYLAKNLSKMPAYNSNLIKGDPKEIKDKIGDNKVVNALVNKTGAYESMDALLFNLNLVISVITLISSALAIVVLYNITSINVGERKRELATVKVLGFYPKEVTSYIYREIFILSILGIVVGFFLGYTMFRYIIDIVAPAEIMIAYRTHPKSYIISGAITLVISLIILFFVHRDLKKIDMAEAMSSGE